MNGEGGVPLRLPRHSFFLLRDAHAATASGVWPAPPGDYLALPEAHVAALVEGIELLRWVERLLPDAEPSNPIRDKILAALDRLDAAKAGGEDA